MMPKEISIQDIRDRIHMIRGLHVMLDEDLAILYDVPTKRLNEQVKRNMSRFPEKFAFQLAESEMYYLKSQIATSSWGGRRTLPYAFTEQGVAMLSGVLKSDTAVRISIQIIDAFVVMRRFIATNGRIFQRLNSIERKQVEYDTKFEQIFDAIQSKDISLDKGIFFDGQVFDAYAFVSGIIRGAKKSIILIDNYIDDSVLILLTKRNKDVSVTILTKEISEQLSLDIEKHNSQYPQIDVKEFKYSHDRFMIIDDIEVYHFGASLKDLGKKWFAFSKFDKEAFKLIDRLEMSLLLSK
ncbi:MAG: ORF6N domain-containing protein [Candidatus Woesearchaeota archaeon]